MNKVLIDSDILIDFFRDKLYAVRSIKDIGILNTIISSITYMELCRGAGNKSELDKIRQELRSYDVLNFNPDVSILAMELISNYHLSHNLQIPDAIIAASAIHYNLKLHTNNKRDFKHIEGLNLWDKN